MRSLDAIAASNEPCVLVTVARAQGSTPREAGTKMLVFVRGIAGTIGGGNLELKAIESARQMLAEPAVPPVSLHRLPLGPSLGQCCGGAATLVLERIDVPRPAWLAELRAALARGESRTLLTRVVPPSIDGPRVIAASGPTRLDEGLAGECTLHDAIAPPDFHVVLFGAGHVGTAIANVLGGLACRVTWIDDRADQFPATPPPNVRTVLSPLPAYEAETIPAGAYCLVMTHTHALDEDICERLLRRGDYAYLGLIGSATKRAQFERRLTARGIAGAALERLVCPIGISGIRSKEPGAIAIGVAAQLLQYYEATHHTREHAE